MTVVTITEEPLTVGDVVAVVDGARVELGERAVAASDPLPESVHRAVRERLLA